MMNMKTTTLFLFILGLFTACSKQQVQYTPTSLDVIPQPVEALVADAEFSICSNTALIADAGLENAAHSLQSYIEAAMDIEMAAKSRKSVISFKIDETMTNDEAYRLTMTPKMILVESKNDCGAFYAVQTLRQLLPVSFENKTYGKAEVQIPCYKISDHPRYSYRGFMLDVSRHFFSIGEVEEVITKLSAYKINKLHLHLSDDQGWRIEIKTWPNLTKIGGTSSVKNEKGGFYTQAEYIQLQKFALKHHIEIIPEIDMPGHTNAALASYAELNCDDKATELYTGTKVGFSSLCVGKPITNQFVGDVIGELAEITFGKYIHIGGDESHSTSDKDYVKFIDDVLEIVKANDKEVIGWDEIANAHINNETVVQFWGKKENAALATSKNAKVIMSPSDRIYLDMKYNEETELGLNWAGYNSIEDAYDWTVDDYVEGVDEKDIFGIEAPLWTETISTSEQIDVMVFPRLIGVAELAWSPKGSSDWSNYQKRLVKHGSRLEYKDIHFHKSSFISWEE